MTYIFLLLSIVLFIYIYYKILTKDIISPSIITYVIYSISIICALIGMLYWNDVYNLGWLVCIIIVFGLISFGLGEYLARKIFENRINKKIKIKPKNLFDKDIDIDIWKIVVISGFILFTIIYTIIQIKTICNNYGLQTNNISEMLKFFREKNQLLSGGSHSAKYDIDFITKQFTKACYVLCAIFSIIFAQSLVYKKGLKSNIKCAIPMILGFISTLLSTGRSIFMHMVMTLIISYIIIYIDKNKGIKINRKVIRNSIIIGVVVITLFYALMPVLGRKNTGGLIEYVSFAIGTHIPSLEKNINNSQEKSSSNMTFGNLLKTLDRINLVDNYKKPEERWYRFDRYSSNTFTSLNSYYKDFGIVGVILLQLIFGFIVTIIYMFVINKKSLFALIFYSYFFYTVIDQIRGDQFYGLITSSTIAYIILMMILYYFVFYKFSLNKIRKNRWRSNEANKGTN